jgi:predicted dehydrogenase
MANEKGALRVAVIGTSFGCQAHVRALKAAGFEVAALVGRDASRTRERAVSFGIATALTSYEEALALPALDAVVIATPPATHKLYALQALGQGKHVLCEKPMALNAAEAQEMCAAGQASGLVNLLVNQLRFQTDYVTLKHAVESGALGNLRHATFVLDAGVCIDRQDVGVPDWWYDKATGGGWLRNLGTHLFDLVRYTVGDFEAVNASVEPGSEFKINADIAFNVLFRLRNGLQGIMQGCGSTFDASQIFRVTGSAATAAIEPGAGVWLTTARGRERVTPPGNYSLPPGFDALPDSPGASRYEINHNRAGGWPEYTALARAFHDAIAGRVNGRIKAADFRDGVAHMQVLKAIEESVDCGGWVDVPGPPG